MENKKQMYRGLNALYLAADKQVVDSIIKLVNDAMIEEYNRGIEDGKTIQEHGTTNWQE